MKKPVPVFLAVALAALLIVSHASAELHRLGLFTEGGVPHGPNPVNPSDPVKILVNQGYAVGYSEDLKVPLWAVYRLGNLKSQTEHERWERPARFEVDYRTVSKVSHDDYERNWEDTTWDRGHMAPNAAMERQYGQLAQLETYLMTNICPQTSKLNQGLWARLEGEIRDTISQDDTNGKEVTDVWVIVGPIFEERPVKRWPSGVAVPSHFFHVVAYRKGYRGTVKAAAFIFPQRPQSTVLGDYLVTVDEVELRTGFDLFPELSTQKQRNLESVKRDLHLEE